METTMGWQAYIKTYGEKSYNTSGLVFSSKAESDSYGNGLLSRWYSVETFYSAEVNEPIKYRFNYETGKAESLS